MIDKMIGEILIGMMTPTTLEVALAVQEEVEQQYAQVMHIYQQRVEAARYEADLARRCYRQVDPDNRLVASTLEADWNEKLKTLEQAQMDYQEQQNNKNNYLSEQQKQEVLSLTQNFKGLWYSEDTPDRERKRIVRLLIEDVTLHQNEQITLHIRFKGGTFQTLTFPRGKQCFESLITPPNIVEEVKRLSDKKNYRQIADHLNKQGFVTAHGLTFTHQIIWQICHAYNIKSRYHQLRERGFLTGKELRKLVQKDCLTIRRWREQGTLDYEIIGGNLFLYYPLDDMTIEQLKKQEIKPDVVREIDRLLNEKNNRQIAEYLNEQGFITAHSTGFTHQIVREICRAYGIKSRYDRLREKGLLTLGEVCDILQRSCATIKNWEKEGKLGYIPINKVCTLYHPLDDTKIAKLITKKTKGI